MIWPLSQISYRVSSFEAPVSLTRIHYGNILNLRLHLYCSLHLLVVSEEDGPRSSLPQTSQPFSFTNNNLLTAFKIQGNQKDVCLILR